MINNEGEKTIEIIKNNKDSKQSENNLKQNEENNKKNNINNQIKPKMNNYFSDDKYSSVFEINNNLNNKENKINQ